MDCHESAWMAFQMNLEKILVPPLGISEGFTSAYVSIAVKGIQAQMVVTPGRCAFNSQFARNQPHTLPILAQTEVGRTSAAEVSNPQPCSGIAHCSPWKETRSDRA